jgi:actin-related protein 3
MKAAVVIDCGTGYTKAGFANNSEPSFVIPTCVSYDDVVGRDSSSSTTTTTTTTSSPFSSQKQQQRQMNNNSNDRNSTNQNNHRKELKDLSYDIGQDAINNVQTRSCAWPIQNGIVKDFTNFEKFVQRVITKNLRCDPEEHLFLLTEPPLNPAENRERVGEIMFETFNVPGVHVGVQAVLALSGVQALISSSKSNSNSMKGGNDYNSDHSNNNDGLTGTVIDIGDGVTHVIPVCDGYVVGSAIKSVPLAGKDLTRFVQTLMRERGEDVPPEEFSRVAQRVKERYCYVSKDIAKEFELHERNPSEYVIKMKGIRARTNLPWQADVGYERFLAPEVFFRPDMIAEKENGFSQFSLPELVDNAIQECPIDSRRKLYGNIVLSGGSTMFKGFGKRVKRDVKRVVDRRVAESEAKSGNLLKAKAVDVEVFTHHMQRYAVWFGGSVVASMPDFYKSCHTREEYFEYGPQVMRSNVLEKQDIF